MPPSGPPTTQEIRKIARRTTDIIRFNITTKVCLFGSAACSLWVDIGRVPNDIDIVVSEENKDAEDIKEAIAGADNRYYLERSRQRGATHQILYCRLPGWKTDPERCVKIDILVPPTLGLPEIPDINCDLETILLGDWIPVMPIFDLLVMKTQGWWDHRTSPRSDFRAKERADVSDIFALLERAREERVYYNDEGVFYDDGAVIGPPLYPRSEEFMVRALFLVKRFVRVYGSHDQWRALKFRV